MVLKYLAAYLMAFSIMKKQGPFCVSCEIFLNHLCLLGAEIIKYFLPRVQNCVKPIKLYDF